MTATARKGHRGNPIISSGSWAQGAVTSRQLQSAARLLPAKCKLARGRDSHQKELERLAPVIAAGADLFAAEQEHLIVHLDLSIQ